MKLKEFIILLLIAKTINTNSMNECKRNWESNRLIMNCSNRGFTEFPVIEEDIPIEHFDLSHNHIQEFPKTYAVIKSLTYLDLSNNGIQTMSSDALVGFDALRSLNLANNNIQSWGDICSNMVFQHAHNLQNLSLAGNLVGRFSDSEGAPALVSDTVTELDISNCGITQLNNVLDGLPQLKILHLSGNNLRYLNGLQSTLLEALDASNCSLDYVAHAFFESVPNLEVLNLSRNLNVNVVAWKSKGEWKNLQQIDISFCNLTYVDLGGFPNLKVVILKNNRFQYISDAMFLNNTALETFDLSHNEIQDMDLRALTGLKVLNLSHNKITQIREDQFQYNNALQSINLSHNMLNEFPRFNLISLQSLTMSWCEISFIDPSAFTRLPVLISLNLSNNPITLIPNGMSSKTLRELDLSACRLLSITNDTFAGFRELASINLSGNHFNYPFSPAYFTSNVLLAEIWLGNNPWFCHCYIREFLTLYKYVTQEPKKLQDEKNLKCIESWEGNRTWKYVVDTCAEEYRITIGIYIFPILLFVIILSYSLAKLRFRRQIKISQQNRIILEHTFPQNTEDLCNMNEIPLLERRTTYPMNIT